MLQKTVSISLYSERECHHNKFITCKLYPASISSIYMKIKISYRHQQWYHSLPNASAVSEGIYPQIRLAWATGRKLLFELVSLLLLPL